MMISPVSFRATTTDWNALLEKKQTFQSPTATATPAAASGLNEGAKKKGGVAKKILGAIIGLGLAAGALALGHKKGVFVAKEGANKYIKQGVELLDKGGKWVAENSTKLWGSITKGFGTIKEKATELFGKIKAGKAS